MRGAGREGANSHIAYLTVAERPTTTRPGGLGALFPQERSIANGQALFVEGGGGRGQIIAAGMSRGYYSAVSCRVGAEDTVSVEMV